MNEIPAPNHISASMLTHRLSSLIRKVIAGESFIITDDESAEPIAELVPASDEDLDVDPTTGSWSAIG